MAYATAVGRSKRPFASTASLQPSGKHAEHRLDALQVVGERRAADLHLHHRVAAVEVAPHLVLELGNVLAGVVVAAGGVDEDARIGRAAAAIALGQQAEQRLARDLRHRVPHRHVDRAHGDGTLAVAARLLVAEHRRPDLAGSRLSPLSSSRLSGAASRTRGTEPLADQAALPVAAVGVEAVAHHRPAVPDHVGDDRDQAQGHLAEIDVGVGDGRRDRDRPFPQIGDAHAGFLLCVGEEDLTRSVAGVANAGFKYIHAPR